MKKQYLFLLALSAVICMRCTKAPSDAPAPDTVNIPAIESLSDFDVPVQAGKSTIVTLGEDTLAVTQSPMTIMVPRYAARNGEIAVTYSDEDIYDNFASSVYWQYVSFEDTRNADYDYNDLVIHGRIISGVAKRENGVVYYKHTVYVQPIALGSSTTIKLGILYRSEAGVTELSDKILTEDVRNTLFLGNPIFPINTDPKKEIRKVSGQLTNLFEITNTEPHFKVVWFIETPAAGRLYAATTNFGADKTYDMVSVDGLPYGISLTKKWDYPIEKCNIRKAYDGFDEWIKTGNEETLLKNKNKEWTFPASPPKNDGEDLWEWDR